MITFSPCLICGAWRPSGQPCPVCAAATRRRLVRYQKLLLLAALLALAVPILFFALRLLQ